RPVVIDFVEVKCNVSRVDVEGRCLDLLHAAPLRQLLDVGSDVGPMLSAIARHLHQAIVGAYPDHVGVNRRDCDGKNGIERFRAAMFSISMVPSADSVWTMLPWRPAGSTYSPSSPIAVNQSAPVLSRLNAFDAPHQPLLSCRPPHNMYGFSSSCATM